MHERQVLRTLVIEDNEADQMMMQGLLIRVGQMSEWQPEVLLADTLKEAIELATTGTPDLLVMDLNLPDSSGLETLKRLQGVSPHSPKIIVSGMDDRLLSRRAVREGAQDYVIKDELNAHVLLKSVEQTMARASLEEELRKSRKRTMENELLRQNEEIRAEIGRELHDVLSQNLTAMTFLLRRLHLAPKEEGQGSTNPKETGLLNTLSLLLDEAILDVTRLSHGLYPAELERRGIAGALEELTLVTSSIHEIACAFRGAEVDLDPQTSLHLYRIAQESISNAVKHGEPTCILVALQEEAGQLILEIRDDGKGFDPKTVTPGLGQSTIAYRSDAIGGTLAVESTSGGGTQIRCRLPIEDETATAKMLMNHP